MTHTRSTDRPSRSLTRNTLKRVGEGLYRNPFSGAYFAHFRLNGHVIKKNLGTTELAVAKRKLRDLRNEQEHLDPNAGKQTLRDVIDRHLRLQANLSRSSIVKKKGIAKTIYEMWPGGVDRPVLDVRPSEVEEWLQTSTSGHRNATRNEWLFFIKGAFARAVRDGALARSPASHLMPEKRQAVERLTPTTEQFREIIRTIRETTTNRFHRESGDFVGFMGLSGLGNGEAAALKVRDVDMARGKIWVRRQKTDTGFYIPIFPRLRPLVVKLLERNVQGPNASSLPFLRQKGLWNRPAAASTTPTSPSAHYGGCSSLMHSKRV